MDIMTKRPKGMSMEEYKSKRALQGIKVKHRLKGQMVWLSKLHPTMKTINAAHEFGPELMALFSKGQTYKKEDKK